MAEALDLTEATRILEGRTYVEQPRHEYWQSNLVVDGIINCRAPGETAAMPRTDEPYDWTPNDFRWYDMGTPEESYVTKAHHA